VYAPNTQPDCDLVKVAVHFQWRQALLGAPQQ